MNSRIKISAFTFALLAACSSFDLGKEEPDSIAVNTTNPTWDADIQPIITAKCTNCHTNNKSQFVPSNVPSSSLLNSMNNLTTFESIALTIKRRVFDTPENPMPPHFGTPLSTDEREALRKYLETNIESPRLRYCAASSTSKVFADVSGSFQTFCATCHSSNGSMPTIPLTTLAEIRSVRDNIVQQLGEKTMPPDASSFHSSTERDDMLEWTCGGSDLE